MKHRDRVIMSLNHQEPDRCPMQISFTPEFASRRARACIFPQADIIILTAAAIRTSWRGLWERTCSSRP